MAELGRVQFGDAIIEYQVQRSERRRNTVQLTMDAGRVLVAAPSDTPDSKLQAIVLKRAPGYSAKSRTQYIEHLRNASSVEKRCLIWDATYVW